MDDASHQSVVRAQSAVSHKSLSPRGVNRHLVARRWFARATNQRSIGLGPVATRVSRGQRNSSCRRLRAATSAVRNLRTRDRPTVYTHNSPAAASLPRVQRLAPISFTTAGKLMQLPYCSTR